MQHGSHINISLKFFFLKRTTRKNVCEKCCVGTVIYSDKCGKAAVRGTVDAEINNVIYMELYSGAKMADGKYRKTYVAVSIDRENTVIPQKSPACSLPPLLGSGWKTCCSSLLLLLQLKGEFTLHGVFVTLKL
jgi:hypothetical protein